jgi:hypothetical protein
VAAFGVEGRSGSCGGGEKRERKRIRRLRLLFSSGLASALAGGGQGPREIHKVLQGIESGPEGPGIRLNA